MLIEKKMFIYGLKFVQQTLTIRVYILKKSIVHGCMNLSNYQLCSAAISNGYLPWNGPVL